MAEILVIDDEQQMRRLMSRILKSAGHAVHEAVNGREGIQRFLQLQPALVITDIVMPDLDGIETIRAIRQHNPAVPILAISGTNHTIYLRAATEFGAMAALQKPFRPDELLAAIAKLLDPAIT
jgi:two-component system chemotaxis response regulator CheY